MSTPENSRRSKGTVYQEGDHWYWRRYQQGRELPRTLLGSKHSLRSRAAAEAERDQQLLRLNPKGVGTGRVLTVRELTALYLRLHIALKKPSTRDSAASVLNKHVIPHLGTYLVPDVDTLALKQLVATLHAVQLAPGSIRNVLAYLRSMFVFARESGFQAPPWPARGQLALPHTDVTAPRRWFTPDECWQMIEASDGPWRALITCMATLAVRCGEVLGLCWSAIDFEQGVVRVRQNVVKRRVQTVKSKTSQRDLPLSPSLSALLTEYRAAWEPNEAGLLFHEQGVPLTNAELNRYLAALLVRLGIPHGTSHSFRHGAGTTMARHHSLRTVQVYMGHQKVDTTQGYTHTLTEDGRAAFDDLSNQILVTHDRRKPEGDPQ